MNEPGPAAGWSSGPGCLHPDALLPAPGPYYLIGVGLSLALLGTVPLSSPLRIHWVRILGPVPYCPVVGHLQAAEMETLGQLGFLSSTWQLRTALRGLLLLLDPSCQTMLV